MVLTLLMMLLFRTIYLKETNRDGVEDPSNPIEILISAAGITTISGSADASVTNRFQPWRIRRSDRSLPRGSSLRPNQHKDDSTCCISKYDQQKAISISLTVRFSVIVISVVENHFNDGEPGSI